VATPEGSREKLTANSAQIRNRFAHAVTGALRRHGGARRDGALDIEKKIAPHRVTRPVWAKFLRSGKAAGALEITVD
jgi:hypothetical protein